MKSHFGHVPPDYLAFAAKATELELQHCSGQYIRIWGPIGCMEMDEAYGIRARIADAFPIGDDGGGQVIFYRQGMGLYRVGFGDLDAEAARRVAPDLRSLLQECTGIDSF